MTSSLTAAFRPPLTKVCTCCKIEKPVKEFYRNPKSADGINWTCKACGKEYDDKKRREKEEYGKHFFDHK